MDVRPHVTQNVNRPGGSAIDARTTRHAGYEISQKKRPLIDRVFGWMKSAGPMRKVKLRGFRNVDWLFPMTAAAFNLWRIPKLVQGWALTWFRSATGLAPVHDSSEILGHLAHL